MPAAAPGTCGQAPAAVTLCVMTPNGMTVRLMVAADIEPVRWVVYRAYAEAMIELFGAEAAAQYQVRAPEFMRLYLDRDPEGNFVAETVDGTIVGAVFCFVWGSAGWFGSLAVAPERQGRGIGQALAGRAVQCLDTWGCRRIGLETWPQSARVHHLYAKFGFVPCRSTMKLTRDSEYVPAAPAGAGAWRPRWITRRRLDALAAGLEAVSAVTARVSAVQTDVPAPDYRQEVLVPVTAGYAELLVVADATGEAQAFALCNLKRPSGDSVTALDVRLLLVAPGARDAAALDAVLSECDKRALELQPSGVSCDVNLRFARAARLLRQRAFHPTYELLRMERPAPGIDVLARSAAIECARWAG